MGNDLEKAEKDLAQAEKDLTKAEGEVAEAEKALVKAEKDVAEAKHEIAEAKEELTEAEKKGKIEVSISTTAGFYPAEGFDLVPEHQHVQHELDQAKHALHIKDVTGWIATVVTPSGKRTIEPAKSYIENGLTEKAEIDWGPSEGGGG